jgi:sugar/nucleoside kinase (ribokinase family)
MATNQELRNRCAQRLLAAASRVPHLSAFVGLDGFVDDILHVVDKRQSAENWMRLTQMTQWADRIRAAAGRSTNIELVSQMMKLGGNGPIMANALASFGLKVSYLGVLGFPTIHEVFQREFTQRAEVHSIAEPGYTYAVEFEDGKVMLGKHEALKDMNWTNIQQRFGVDQLRSHLASADLVGFVNWTMLPYMSEVWTQVQREICPQLTGPRRKLFVDLADPEKREKRDIVHALDLVVRFGQWFDVILGLNEKEAHEVAKALDLDAPADTPEQLTALARAIHARVPVQTLVVHPVSYALTISQEGSALVTGPVATAPKITTGAGDHFNSGFCLGKLLGLGNEDALLTGVSTSGYYVRTAVSPSVGQIAELLQDASVPY